MAHYVHGHAESVLRSHRWRTVANSAGYLAPHLTVQQHLLDVGSGPGTLTCDLARHVGRVTAVERRVEVADLTRQEALRQDLSNVAVEVADVHALPFADNAFDVSHAHQVLQHVPDPVQALRELARVTRPGGLVAVRESDYGAFFYHPASARIERWRTLYSRLARLAGGEPDAGRLLPAWAAAAGLRDVTVTCSTWCFTSDDDRRWWASMWADRVLDSDFAVQAAAQGVSPDELRDLARGWRDWAEAPDGLFGVVSVECLARI